MKLLSKDEILKADDLPYEDVEVPEWKGRVRIRTMTGAERDSYEGQIYQLKGKEVKFVRDDMRAKLLSRCIVDEKGSRMFTDAEMSALSRKSGAALDRLFKIAMTLNGLSEDSQKDMEKNSKSEGADISSSPSPEN